MKLENLKVIWNNAIKDLLNTTFEDDVIEVLALQTIDSIRRIQIYETYSIKAEIAENSNLPYHHTSNPFTLSQRESLDQNSKAWYIYLATYFGKSNKSKWELFNRSAFKSNKELIKPETILLDKEKYYASLRELNFFNGMNYSNHRKYSKKSLDGKKGVFQSMDYFLDNISSFALKTEIEFDVMYKESHKVPNFGRMAAFDFTSSMCKCKLNVKEPKSMYQQYSSGPLKALKDLLIISKKRNKSKEAQITLGNDLLSWFEAKTNIFVVAQVLEDAICNWQKSPKKYKKYFG